MNEVNRLHGCLLDSDFAARRQTKACRRRALLISIAVEGAILALLLFWPLGSPSVFAPLRTSRVFRILPYAPHAPTGRGSGASPFAGVFRDRLRRLTPVWSQPVRIPRGVTNQAEVPPTVGATELPGGSPQFPGSGSVLGLGTLGGSSIVGAPVAPRRPAKAPLKVSSGVQEARLVFGPAPSYPAIARHMRLSGTVVLSAIIATDGSIESMQVLSGPPILARAAIGALGRWRYRPTYLNGQPVEVQTSITVNFVLPPN